MKDPNLSELVRTCIRCWLYLVPQAFLGIHLFDMFMRRKNSIKPLMIWQLLRVFLIGGISDIILRGYYGNESWWGILMMFCSVVIMIANTVLIYYTFEGSLPKVVLGAMLADIVTSMIHYPAICIVDLLSGRPLYILKCPVEPWDLLIPVLEYLFYRLEKKTILHVLRRYRDFEARYLKIIWVFVYFLPVLYYVPNGLTDIQVMFLDDILIIPSWEDVKPSDEDKMVIHIDPGTAFGTGMHETTQLCIRQIRKYTTETTKILDVGCGSGILGMLALKFGAEYSVGTDLDPCAIDATYENMENNGISKDKYEVMIGNIINDKEVQDKVGYECYDIVAANILAPVLVELTPVIVNQLKPGGIYITSGIIDDKEEMVKEAVAKAGLELLEVTYQGEWVCVTARKNA